MNRTAILMLVATLGACDVQSHKGAGDDQNVTFNADEGGNVAFNLPFIKGQVKVPTGMMHNGNFDLDGVKLMPGSTLTGVSVFAADKGSTVNVAFKAPASADAVRSYFVDQFKKQGVEAAMSGATVTGRSKDGAPFTIDVQPAAGGSTGTIAIQSKD